MENDFKTVYEALHRIYQKHRRRYRRNPDSKQMCCMWATIYPPDIVEGTRPFIDIEKAFGIVIDDDTAFDLYDMTLKRAARKIMAMRTEQGQQ